MDDAINELEFTAKLLVERIWRIYRMKFDWRFLADRLIAPCGVVLPLHESISTGRKCLGNIKSLDAYFVMCRAVREDQEWEKWKKQQS